MGKDLFDEWLQSIDLPNTRNNYGPYFRRLLQTMQVSVEEMRTRLKASAGEAWREAKLKSREPAFTPKGRLDHPLRLSPLHTILRRFPTERQNPESSQGKTHTIHEMEQALKLCDAATPPYRWIFRLSNSVAGEFASF